MNTQTVLVLIGLFALCSCLVDTENEVISMIDIPNINCNVVLFSRNGNATVSKNYQVSIIAKGDKFKDEPGNAFICDKADSVTIQVVNKGVVVAYTKGARIFKQIKNINGVSIVYNME